MPMKTNVEQAASTRFALPSGLEYQPPRSKMMGVVYELEGQLYAIEWAENHCSAETVGQCDRYESVSLCHYDMRTLALDGEESGVNHSGIRQALRVLAPLIYMDMRGTRKQRQLAGSYLRQVCEGWLTPKQAVEGLMAGHLPTEPSPVFAGILRRERETPSAGGWDAKSTASEEHATARWLQEVRLALRHGRKVVLMGRVVAGLS